MYNGVLLIALQKGQKSPRDIWHSPEELREMRRTPSCVIEMWLLQSIYKTTMLWTVLGEEEQVLNCLPYHLQDLSNILKFSSFLELFVIWKVKFTAVLGCPLTTIYYGKFVQVSTLNKGTFCCCCFETF